MAWFLTIHQRPVLIMRTIPVYNHRAGSKGAFLLAESLFDSLTALSARQMKSRHILPFAQHCAFFVSLDSIFMFVVLILLQWMQSKYWLASIHQVPLEKNLLCNGELHASQQTCFALALWALKWMMFPAAGTSALLWGTICPLAIKAYFAKGKLMLG